MCVQVHDMSAVFSTLSTASKLLMTLAESDDKVRHERCNGATSDDLQSLISTQAKSRFRSTNCGILLLIGFLSSVHSSRYIIEPFRSQYPSTCWRIECFHECNLFQTSVRDKWSDYKRRIRKSIYRT